MYMMHKNAMTSDEIKIVTHRFYMMKVSKKVNEPKKTHYGAIIMRSLSRLTDFCHYGGVGGIVR